VRNTVGGGIATLLVFFLIPLSSIAADYFQPGVNYAPNAIVIVFQQDISPIEFAIQSGIVSCGIQEVDRLNREFGVSYIWPLFPGARDRGEPSMAGYYSITFDAINDLEKVLESFEKLQVVEHVEPVGIHKVSFIPNDPYVASQWGVSKIGSYAAWNISQGDPAILLGIPDTGVDWDHPDLNDHVWINEEEWNGTPGVDDDNNGYVDDFRGWDWVTGVNGWPGEDDRLRQQRMDFDGYGTHVPNAERNHTVSAAGIGFNRRIMALGRMEDIDGPAMFARFHSSASTMPSGKGAKVSIAPGVPPARSPPRRIMP
jgi:hypothetical protein